MANNNPETKEKKFIAEGRGHAWVRTIAIVACAVIILIMFFSISSAITNLAESGNELLEHANSSLAQADEAIGTINGVAEDMDQVVSTIKDADLASVIGDLHDSVNNLNTVVGPLAKLVGAFN